MTLTPAEEPALAADRDRFVEVLDEIRALHDRKQKDYGKGDDPFANIRSCEEWGIPPWVGAFVRINDKVHRLKRFAERGTLANESAEDSMLDIAVYALISLVLYREQSEAAEGVDAVTTPPLPSAEQERIRRAALATRAELDREPRREDYPHRAYAYESDHAIWRRRQQRREGDS